MRPLAASFNAIKYIELERLTNVNAYKNITYFIFIWFDFHVKLYIGMIYMCKY